MDLLKQVLLNNRAWAKEKLELRSSYFRRMLRGQNPKILWIGCADSRVPAEEITCSQPGELFVHRNIANIFNPEDPSAMSVLEFSVAVLKVEAIVICGHYGCGGIRAAIDTTELPHVSRWLAPARQVLASRREEVTSKSAFRDQANALVRLNVTEGVRRLAQTEMIQEAWKRGNSPRLAGWVYDTFGGELSQLIEIDPLQGTNCNPVVEADRLVVTRS